jgi:predicted anti-sigma-YlaC factor YlaD
MPCEKYRETLIEAAATSAAPSRELRSHLDGCTSCRAAYTEELQLFAAIDVGVRITANSEVPLSFLPRLRARLEDVAAPQRRWMPSLIFAGAAVAIVLTAFIVSHARHTSSVDSAKQLPVTPSGETPATPTRRDAASLSATEASSHPNHRRPLRDGSARQATASVHLEVIVPPDEREAFARFIATMQEGRDVTVAFVKPPPNKVEEPMSVALLQIAELEVQPLEGAGSEVPDSTEEKQ